MNDTASSAWSATQTLVDWSVPDRVPPLADGEIHLWWSNLTIPANERQNLHGTLSAAEQQRVARFKFAQDRHEFIAARGGLRILLGAYLGQDPAGLRFELGTLGKPSLPQDREGRRLCFNYSDSGGHALYAFAWDCELGVDLEQLGRRVRFERIIRRKFTAAEADALFALPDDQQRDAFLACWTRKEGYGKAEGFGIRFPLDSVELCRDCARPVMRIGGRWTLRQIYPGADFVGAIVYDRDYTDLSYSSLDARLRRDLISP